MQMLAHKRKIITKQKNKNKKRKEKKRKNRKKRKLKQIWYNFIRFF